MKEDRIEEILEQLFKNGYQHGISKGESDLGEYCCVSQAKSQLIDLMLGMVKEAEKNHGTPCDCPCWESAFRQMRQNIEGIK